MKPQLALELPKSGHYVVAVSGGVDSVSLLHMLLDQPNHDLRLRVVHVNHGLRPEAVSDERFVRELARAYDLPFHSVQLELGVASEAQARDLRYKFLHAVMQAQQARGIITAHHADDRVETSIFNTLRGSGRHGQAASFVRQQVLRPLLAVRKADLYNYAKERGLAWREDSTNQDTSISRNLIRRELVGNAPGYHMKHQELMTAQHQLNQLLDRRLAKAYYNFKVPAGIELPRSWIASEPWPALAAFMHFALRKLAPDREFSQIQIESLVRVAKSSPAGNQISLPGALKLQVGYDKVAIVVAAPETLALPSIQLTAQTSLRYGTFWLIYGSQLQTAPTSVLLPKGHYTVRTTKAGDRMRTAAGSKKIQDIFVDKKVDRRKRMDWPVIINESNEILWLPKLAIDPSLMQTTEGYQLIVEEV